MNPPGEYEDLGDTQLFHNANGLTYMAAGDETVNCTVSVCPVEMSTYGYRPSLAFSGTIIALYGTCLVVQLILGFRYKKWGFMAMMVLGCIDEMIGYVGRILYYQNPWGSGGFIIQIVLITIGPVFFAAAIYVLLYQIVIYISRKAARFNPIYFYWIFIPCDVVSLILQASGGAMSATSNGKSQAGVDIALAGLIFQVITLTLFTACVVDYGWRSRKSWTLKELPGRFILFASALALATTLIFIRCCYRVYELSEGYSRTSEALRDETMFNVLEGVMVVAAAVLLIFAHPGFVFKDGVLQRDVQMYMSVKKAEGSEQSDADALS